MEPLAESSCREVLLIAMVSHTLYKGAARGTHWHSNNARLSGFLASAMPQTGNGVVRHITNYSNPSPYLSFSSSFAIARRYALLGPGGVATQATPGYVYEIDLQAAAFQFLILNPVDEVSSLSNGHLAHHHEGDAQLISEVALGVSPPSTAPRCGGKMHIPGISGELQALIFAIRDAEVLISGNVPPTVIVRRHDVY